MKRTFIAVPVRASAQLKNLLVSLQSKLQGEAIKWVEPDILHITLKFLGDTPEELINPVSEKLESVLSRFGKMEGRMMDIGTFSSHGNPAVLYTRLVDLPLLDEMAELIGKEMESLGFTADPKKFKAHLTLARIKYLRDKKKFLGLADSMKDTEIQPVVIEKVVFFESVLRPQGPLYTALKTFSLK